MEKNLKDKKIWIVIYLVIAIMFFNISLKLSGSEAYHSTGIVAYLKWTILGFLLNTGYVISATRIGITFPFITLLLMNLAPIINILIFTNPKDDIFYNVLFIILFFIGTVLTLEKAFQYGKDLYSKRRS